MVVITGLVVWALAVQGTQSDRAAKNAERTTRSLCALRHDLEVRVQGGERFLREHPRGIPGIPAKTLRQSVGGQRRTIRALGGLKCAQT